MTIPARRQSTLRWVSRGAGCAVALIGGSALVGWAFEVGALKSVVSGMVEMKANTAACFVLAGLALGLARSRGPRTVAVGLAGLVVVVAVLTVFQYATGRRVGLDELLFRDEKSLAMGLPPGRMALATAVAFALTGSALILGLLRRIVLAQSLTLAAVLIPLFSLLAYLFREWSITLKSPYTSLAINTAAAFALLGVGILCECCEAGPMAVLVAEGPGSTTLRRLLPLSVAMTLGLGFVAYLGARAGLYSMAAGMVLLAVVTCAALTFAIWTNGWLLNRAEAARRLEHDWLQLTLRSIGDAVIATDREGRVHFLNRVAETLTGWKGEEAAGLPLRTVFRIVNETTRSEAENPVDRVLATGMVVGLANHTALIARDGREWPIDDSAAPIKDDRGGTTGVVLVFREIGDRKRAEDRLREADRRKDEFLAMLAHELRNPLAAIANAVGVATRGGVREHVDWAMEVIARQMRHLTRLIDDLLDVSRISRGKIELRRDVLEVTPILDAAVATLRAFVEERGHTLDLAIDRGNLWVDADPTRIEQVVVNLLNNAAKYSEDGGHIRLWARNAGDDVVLSVADRGVGIAAEALPQMFELFAQADRSLARSEGGLGIGLTVVKNLVEMHGGTVTAASGGIGRGSEFTVRLPAARRPAAAMAEAPRPVETAGVKSRILVVDDNEDMARGMARLLKLLGHEVKTAYTGPEGIEAAGQHRPEFVLLDIGLPGMDGYEVATRLRREECCRGATFIAISGYGQDEDRRRSKAAGFDHHLVKPLDYDALLKLLAVKRNGDP